MTQTTAAPQGRSAAAGDVELEAHHATLVVPFLHRGLPALGDDAKDLNRRWQLWLGRLGPGTPGDSCHPQEVERALDASWFLLPHLRRLMAAETQLLPDAVQAEVGDPAEEAWKPSARCTAAVELAALPASEIIEKLLALDDGPEGLLRLTSKAAVLGSYQLQLQTPVDVEVCWADALLFPDGLGLLALRVEVPGALTAATLRDVLKALRVIHRPALSMAPVLMARDDTTTTMRDVVDTLLAGLADVPEGRNYTDTDEGQVYAEQARTWTFAASAAPRRPAGSDGPDLSLAADRALVELTLLEDLDDSSMVPAPERLTHWWSTQRIALWSCWHALVTREHVVFLGLGRERFNRDVLRYVVDEDYLPLYYLVVYQQVRLHLMAQRLTALGPVGPERVRAMRQIAAEFLTFRNDHWFAEVSGKSQGHALYVALQHALGVQRLFDTVRDEVHDLLSYGEAQSQRAIERRLAAVTTIGAPVALVLAFLSAVDKFQTVDVAAPATGIALAVGLALFSIMDRQHTPRRID